MSVIAAILGRDLRLALRQGADAATGLVFFIIVATLFTLAIGPEPRIFGARRRRGPDGRRPAQRDIVLRPFVPAGFRGRHFGPIAAGAAAAGMGGVDQMRRPLADQRLTTSGGGAVVGGVYEFAGTVPAMKHLLKVGNFREIKTKTEATKTRAQEPPHKLSEKGL